MKSYFVERGHIASGSLDGRTVFQLVLPLIMLLMVSALVPQRLRAQGWPAGKGKDTLVITKDSTPVLSMDVSTPRTLGRVNRGTEMEFFSKLGTQYIVLYNNAPAIVPLENVRVVSRSRVPEFSEEQNQMLEQIKELLTMYDRLKKANERRKGMPLLVKAVELLNATLGKDHSITVSQTNNLGDAYLDFGEVQKARELLSKSLESARKLKGDPSQLSTILGNLARAEGTAGSFSRAKQLFEEAIKIVMKETPEDSRSQALLLNNYASVLRDNGYFNEAYEAYSRSLEITRNSEGTDGRSYPVILNNLALLAQSKGHYSEARLKFEESIRLRKKVYGPESRQVGIGLLNLSALLDQLGDLKSAIDKNTEAFQILIKKLGPDHPESLKSIALLASFCEKGRQFERAHQLYEMAYKGRAKVFGEDHPQTILAFSKMVTVLSTLGKSDEAVSLCQDKLRIMTEKYNETHPVAEQLRVSIANLYCDAREFEKAAEISKQISKIQRETFGPYHPRFAKSECFLALMLARSGRHEEAFEAAIRSRKAYLRTTAKILPHLSEVEQLKYLKPDRSSLNAAISIALAMQKSQQHIDQAAVCILNGKGRSVEAMAHQVQALRDVKDDESKQLALELLTVQRELAEIAIRNEVSALKRDRSKAIEQLTEREQVLARALDRKGTNLEVSLRSVSLPAVQQRVPKSGVLVDIIRVFPINPDPTQDAGGLPPRYAALVVSPDKPADLIDLGLASEIESLIDDARRALDQGALLLVRKEDKKAEAIVRPYLRDLAKMLYEPISKYVKGKKQIILSLDGPLWLLPWENLLVDKDSYAVERHLFRYVVSGSYLANRNSGFDNVSAPALFGDPDYDYLPPRTEILAKAKRAYTLATFLESPQVGRLPGSRLEVAAAASQVKKVYQGIPRLHLDKEATEARVKQLKSPALLYLSTHGFFSLPEKEKPEPTTLGIVNIAEDYIAVEGNPMLLCGICLTGCNKIGVIAQLGVEMEDGILTGKEALGLDLRGTELVILSACQTSLGDVRYGEGVSGLRQAFHLAGARSVIGTAWSVFDRESAVLMLLFFKGLGETKDKALALQRAQIDLISLLRKEKGAAHPLYWGAFSISYR